MSQIKSPFAKGCHPLRGPNKEKRVKCATEERYCTLCGSLLSIYNKNNQCHHHKHKKNKSPERDKYLSTMDRIEAMRWG